MKRLVYNYVFLIKIFVLAFLLVLGLFFFLSQKNSQQLNTERVLFAIDVSSSMGRSDLAVESGGASHTRLDSAIEWAGVYAKQLSGKELGLLIFADNAELLVPFSSDQGPFSQYLTSLQVASKDMIGVKDSTLFDVTQNVDFEQLVLVSDFGFDRSLDLPDINANIFCIPVGEYRSLPKACDTEKIADARNEVNNDRNRGIFLIIPLVLLVLLLVFL